MAQTLLFTHNPVSGLYETEFQIEKDAVLHVERAVSGRLKLGVRTTGAGKYALVDEFEGQDYKSTIDAELTGEIYPKWVKVSSESEPTYGEVVSDGEVTEIKAQSKEIEVTSNGTMDITPDAGFAYLSAVKVKTNVAGSGGGSASSWRYFDVSQQNEINTLLITLAAQLKGVSNNQKILGPAQFMNMQAESIIGAAIDFSQKIKLVGASTVLTIEEQLTLLGAPIGMATEITEAEFYNLNA